MLFNKSSNTHQAFWVGVGSLSIFAIGLISTAILSRYFDKAEYGTFRQINFVYNTLLVIFSAGLPRVFAYFLPRYPIEQGENIVFKITRLLFLFGLAFSASIFILSDYIAILLNNSELARSLKYFSPIPMLLLPTLGIEGIFSAYRRTLYIAVYNTITRLLMLLFITFPVIVLKGNIIHAIIGWIIVSFISLVLAFYFKKIPFKSIGSKPSTLSFKEIFSYSLPLVGASISGIAINSAPQFFISRYFGSAAFAEYSNGFIQIPFVAMITSATSVVLMPEFSRMVAQNEDVDSIAKIWCRALIRSATIIYPLTIFFLFNAQNIIVTIFTESYSNSVLYFQIAMFANFINIIVFTPLIIGLGEVRFYSRLHFFSAISIWTTNFILLSVYKNPYLIASANVLLALAMTSISLSRVSKRLKLHISELFPLKSFSVLFCHSLLIAVFVLVIDLLLLNSLDHLPLLVLNTLIFATALFFTQRFFKVDYLEIVKSLRN